MRKALTIAGSDAGGGAGIQADLKSFAAMGVYGTSAITALTAQNTLGVQGVFEVPADFIAAQINAVMEDIGADAWKTGMLASSVIVEVVAERAQHYGITLLVVDPVMVAKGGDSLLHPEARVALIERLLPLAYVVTPNHHEAGVLAAMTIETVDDMRTAAERIHALGPRHVIVKGGHLPAQTDAIDVLYDGQRMLELRSERAPTRNTHGTGCTFASALAARLALGEPIELAAQRTKAYVSAAIAHADAMQVGRGHGPLNHMLGQAIVFGEGYGS